MLTETPRIQRFVLLAIGMATLLIALWTGLIRAGWDLSHLRPFLPAEHGPLMISGFLGTVICLERAVALRARWTYAAPALTALGAISVVIGLPDFLGAGLITLGSVMLVAIFVHINRHQPELFNRVLLLAAGLWLAGNGLWLAGQGVSQIILWWTGFLVLTIAGERLELSRMLMHSEQVQTLFKAAAVLFLIGAAVALYDYEVGWRVAGAGFLAIALWMIRYDIARRTVRLDGLTRFIAVCLLSGYAWLGAAGLLALTRGVMGLGYYDAILHMIFLGFVFAMIFGHAPVIFPAVLGIAIPYRPAFYGHLAMLQVSLLMRVVGDLAHLPAIMKWGSMLNAVTLLVFLANTGLSVRLGLQMKRAA